MKFWHEIVIAVVAAILVGLIFADYAIYLQPIGDLFLNAIRMLIVPLIFTSIICAVISIDTGRRQLRILLKGSGLYIITTAMAALLGLSVASYFAPGSGVNMDLMGQQASHIVLPDVSLKDMLVNIIPANPVTAFSTGNVLQIVVFALVFGLALNLAGAPALPAVNFFKALLPTVFKLSALVMRFAPIGIFALIAGMISSFGWQILLPVLKLLGVLWLTCAIMWLFYGLILLVFARLNPLKFYRAIRTPFAFALATTSSAATLPLSMQSAEKNLGVSKKLVGFLLPLGTSINLDGLALYITVAVVFTANLYGIELTTGQYVITVITAIIASMGAGGVPGASIVVIGIVLSTVGLPLEVIALFAAIVRIAEMTNTATNVMGDLFTLTMVAKSEDELDRFAYDN